MMRERRNIVKLWERGDAAALATLVRVEGSSYRQPGARLLIASNGEYAGAISGGCLEAEVIRKASWLVRGGACMQRYSTLFDDTSDLPYGLGCGGTVDVLLEPAGTPDFEVLLQSMRNSLQGEECTVVTRLPDAGAALSRWVKAGLAPGFHQDQTLFHEALRAPQRLFVFGAGDDAVPVVRFAALLGWRVFVMDGRPQWAKPERFPEAEVVLSLNSADPLQIGQRDAAVVMTHSYEQDREWLRHLLPARPRYLGLLGARHRSALLASEAAAMLSWPLKQVCDSLFAPVGLDLGGDGAESIALAVIAEVQACIEGKLGHSRRMSPELIAEHIAEGGASRYLQTQCAV